MQLTIQLFVCGHPSFKYSFTQLHAITYVCTMYKTRPPELITLPYAYTFAIAQGKGCFDWLVDSNSVAPRTNIYCVHVGDPCIRKNHVVLVARYDLETSQTLTYCAKRVLQRTCSSMSK